MGPDELTSIQLHKSTVEKIKKVGKMGETYEAVILRALTKLK